MHAKPAVITVGAHVRYEGTSPRIVGTMTTELPDGSTATRDVDVTPDRPFDLDPPAIAYFLTPGVFEMSDWAEYGGPHGWQMPFRSADGLLYVFEYDFDAKVEY